MTKRAADLILCKLVIMLWNMKNGIPETIFIDPYVD